MTTTSSPNYIWYLKHFDVPLVFLEQYFQSEPYAVLC